MRAKAMDARGAWAYTCGMKRTFLDRRSPPTLFTLVMLAAVSAMAMGIYLPSLPAMATYFQTDYHVVQLSVALYFWVNSVMQIAVGPISDRYGRRPVLLWGCGLFCVATLGCIFAPSIEVFLFFRMFQAVIVTAMVLSRAVIRDTVGATEAASMIGYVTMGMAIVPMLAPALGGALQGSFGWQGSFWVLLIAGLGLWALTYLDVGETHHHRSASFAAQLRDYPELLTSVRFWGYAASAAFASGAFFAYLGGAPYVGADLFGLSPAELGLYLGAPAVGYMVGNGVSGRYSMRFGINRMVLGGMVTASLGLGIMALGFGAGAGSAGMFFLPMILVGLGNGMVLPNATAGMLSVRPHLAGTASGLGGALMTAGGALLAAAAAAVTGHGAGAMPLILLMLGSSLLGLVTILLTVWRGRRVAG